MKYTKKQMDAVRSFADWQFNNGEYLVSVLSEKTGQSVNCPWVDSSARFELATDADAVAYWGEKLFSSFCDKALAYIEKHGGAEK